MTQKIEDARKAIADIEQQASRIKEEIKILLDNDERMRRDEVYRNQIVGERLKEVQKLQELSQFHQRTILQNKAKGDSENQARMTTRSRSTGAPAISSVALNMQQMTRQSARASPHSGTADGVMKKASEEQQKASVETLLRTRNILIERERTVFHAVQNEGLNDVSHDMLDEYATVKSLRIWTESLCASIRKDPRDVASIASLREVVKFVASSFKV